MQVTLLNKEKVFVNKIFCLGLNYTEHITEMKHQKPQEPVIFLKANSALSYNNAIIEIPAISSNMHYELELVILIGKEGRNISQSQALEYIMGYGVGIDFTLRDIQDKAKAKGLPWTVAKSFDQSAFISEFIPYTNEALNNLELELKLNGDIRQRAFTKDMLFKIPEIIEYISSLFTLNTGDLIYTGTPSGVGQVVSGDHLEVRIIDEITARCMIK